MSNKVRVLRIMEYVGDREWVENTLKKGSIPADGCKTFGINNENIIKSCLVDKFPETIAEKDNKKHIDCDSSCKYIKFRGTSESKCKNGCIRDMQYI